MNSKINVQPLFSEPRKIVDEFAVGEDEDSCSINLYQPWVSVPAPKIAKTAAVGDEDVKVCQDISKKTMVSINWVVSEGWATTPGKVWKIPDCCTSWLAR